MSILSVIQDAAPKCGFARPSQLIADTSDTSREIQSTLQEVASAIRDRYDWQMYNALATLTGDGSALDFAFPSNYARMSLTAKLWPSAQPNSPLRRVDDLNEWLGMQVQNFSGVYGSWIIYGGRIHIRIAGPTDPLGNLDTVQFAYATNLQWTDNLGAPKTSITADTDIFRLAPEQMTSERLLKLGFIAKWKSDKKRPYAQDQSDFEDALAKLIGTDKGGKAPLVVGRRRVSSDAVYAFPWAIQ